MEYKMISVAKDFSQFPAGRYIADGPFPGQKFRDEYLFPALKTNEVVEVDMDGTLGYGSSFLEEAFGGLVRELGMTAATLHQKLKLKCSVSTYVNRAWQYIDEADASKRK